MAGIHVIARAAGIKDPQAKSLFAAIIQQVMDPEVKRVFVKDFGTFYTKVRKARTIVSPQLLEGKAQVPARTVLMFRASPALKVMLNGNGASKPKAEKPAKATAVPKPAPAAKPAKAKPAKPAPAPAADE